MVNAPSPGRASAPAAALRVCTAPLHRPFRQMPAVNPAFSGTCAADRAIRPPLHRDHPRLGIKRVMDHQTALQRLARPGDLLHRLHRHDRPDHPAQGRGHPCLGAGRILLFVWQVSLALLFISSNAVISLWLPRGGLALTLVGLWIAHFFIIIMIESFRFFSSSREETIFSILIAIYLITTVLQFGLARRRIQSLKNMD